MTQLFNVRNNDQLSGRQMVGGSTIFDYYKTQYLTNTPASDGNTRTFTFSAWVKRSRMSTTNGTVYPTIFTGYKDNNEMDYFQFNENDIREILNENDLLKDNSKLLIDKKLKNVFHIQNKKSVKIHNYRFYNWIYTIANNNSLPPIKINT